MKKLFKLSSIFLTLMILTMTVNVSAITSVPSFDTETSLSLNFCFYKTDNTLGYYYQPESQKQSITNNNIKVSFLSEKHLGASLDSARKKTKYLSGAEFTFENLDGKTKFDVYEAKDKRASGGMYCIKGKNYTEDEIKNLIPSNVIKKIENVKSTKDFLSTFKDNHKGICDKKGACYLQMPYTFVLDETKKPNGYLKAKNTVTKAINVVFSYTQSTDKSKIDPYSNDIKFDKVNYGFSNDFMIDNYNKDYDYNNFTEDFSKGVIVGDICQSADSQIFQSDEAKAQYTAIRKNYLPCYVVDRGPFLRLTKQNSEGKKLEGAKFTLHDFNNKVSYDTHYENPYYMINGPMSDDEVEDILKKLVPSYGSPKTLNDLRKIKSDDDMLDLNLNSSIYDTNLVATTYFILDEAKAPIGYTSKKYLVPVKIFVDYYLNDDKILDEYFDIHLNQNVLIPYTNENIDLLKQELNLVKEYKYDMSDEEKNNLYKKLDDISKQLDKINESTCKTKDDIEENVQNNVKREENNYQNNIKMLALGISMSSYSTCTPIITDEKGKVEFKIDNKVNDKYEYEGIQKESLLYKVIVRNTGNAAAGNNIVTTHLPDGLVYEANSASDGGVYDDKTRTITWRLDYISPGDTHEFTYKATIPDGINATEFIGNSTISGEGMDEVKSGDTVVTIIENPKTGISTHAIMIGIITMLGVGILAYMKKIDLIKKI